MSSPSSIQSGTFLSAGTALNISIPADFNEFNMVNVSDVGDAGATTQVMRAYFADAMPANSAYLNLKTNGAATLQIESMITTLGFAKFDQANPPVFAKVAITAINQANPAQVTSAAHGLQTGDVVVITGITTAASMQSLQGIPFVVTRTGANTFTIPVDTTVAASFPNAAANGFFMKIGAQPLFQPRKAYITAVTAANPMVVSTSVPHTFGIGDIVVLNFPQTTLNNWGMQQADGLQATVTAVPTTTSFTLGAVNSTAFTAFAFPVSAVGNRFTQAFAIDKAELSNTLVNSEDNTGIRGITVGTGVQTTGKTYQWFARKGVQP